MVKKANTGVCDHRAFKISETWLKKTFGDVVHISFSTVMMWKCQGCVNTVTYYCQSNSVVVLRLYALYIQIYIFKMLPEMCYDLLPNRLQLYLWSYLIQFLCCGCYSSRSIGTTICMSVVYSCTQKKKMEKVSIKKTSIQKVWNLLLRLLVYGSWVHGKQRCILFIVHDL